MNRRMKLLAVSLVMTVSALAGCAGGQQCRLTYQAKNADARGFVWEAIGNGQKITLLGTHQAAGRDDVPAHVWQRLAKADVFIVEADNAETGDRYKSGESWFKAFTLPDGQSLMKLLSADDYFDLKRLLKGVHIAIPRGQGISNMGHVLTLTKMKPWVAMFLLAKRTRAFAEPNLSHLLLQNARKLKKPLKFFESWEEQVQFLDQSSSAEKLVRAIHDYPNIRCKMKYGVAAFRMGDDAFISAYEAKENDPIVARIQRWMPKLKDYAANRHAFVAIGLSHLVGTKGILALLEAEGYEINRL